MAAFHEFAETTRYRFERRHLAFKLATFLGKLLKPGDKSELIAKLSTPQARSEIASPIGYGLQIAA
jgi:hypothetical protein